MTSPFGRLVLIANPRAGRGRVGQEMPEVERTLLAKGLEYTIHETSGPGDATRIATEALRAGDRFLVAVGGDGTVHEVVNGMFEDARPIADDAVLGVVAAGSGCDFVKTFGLPQAADKAVAHLTGDSLFPIDVGKVTYHDHDGGELTRLFPNIAEAGLGGQTVERAARLPRFLGRSRYFWGFWLTVSRFKPTELHVQADAKEFSGRANNVVVANGQYFGGGMKISPYSFPDDGFFDVHVSFGPKSESFTLLPKIFKGEHLPHPHIRQMKAKTVEITADRPLSVEADGEVLGSTPARFEVLHRALRLKI